MRPLLVLALVVVLGVGLSACGETATSHRAAKAAATTASSHSGKSSSYWNTPEAKLGGATPAEAARIRRLLLQKVSWVHRAHQPALPNDGDHDEPGDEDHDNNHDTGTGPGSIDPYVDYLPPANNRVYHDEDDELALKFGHAASATEARAAAGVVERYYLAASARDGARACALMAPPFAKSVPLDYGKLGAAYLRGAKTCASVLERLFKHLRTQLTGGVQVTDVRVSGSTALAFIGSHSIRASQIALHREGGRWTVSQLIGAPLP